MSMLAAGTARQSPPTNLARGQQVADPLLDVLKGHIEARTNDTALVDAAVQLDDNLAGAAVVHKLELADVAYSKQQSDPVRWPPRGHARSSPAPSATPQPREVQRPCASATGKCMQQRSPHILSTTRKKACRQTARRTHHWPRQQTARCGTGRAAAPTPRRHSPCFCMHCKNLMITLEAGRISTWRLPRFSALVIVFKASAKTLMRTILTVVGHARTHIA